MRVQPSSRVSRAAPSSQTPRFGASALLLGLALLLAFGLGFLSHQQDWAGAVRSWGSALLRSPQGAFAAWRARQQLPTLTLDLGFSDYQLLAAVRAQALRQGVSTPSVEQIVIANGILPGSGESRPVELRLPGGVALGEAEDAWSLELRPEGSNVWQRLIPVTDALSAWQQWGYLETLRQNGFAAAELELLNLTVNGASWGLYLLETPATAPLTAGFDARPAWEALAQGQVLPDGGFRYAVPAVSAAAASDPAAREAYARFRAVLEDEPFSSVTSAEDWGRFLALTLLWTGAPAPDWSTLRWSFDPVTGQFEALGSAQPAAISPLPAAVFADPAVQTATARALAEFGQPANLETLRESLGEELDLRWRVLAGAAELADPWSALVNHQRAMQAYLAPERPLAATLEPSGDDFVVRLANLQPFPLQVTGVDVGGAARRDLELSWVDSESRGALLENAAGAFVLRAASGNTPQPIEVHLPRELLSSGGELVLLCKLWDAPAPEVRVSVLETLPLLEEQP